MAGRHSEPYGRASDPGGRALEPCGRPGDGEKIKKTCDGTIGQSSTTGPPPIKTSRAEGIVLRQALLYVDKASAGRA